MGILAGPSAFPSEQHETRGGEWNQTFDPGMSLRDYFAAQSINSLLITATGIKIDARIIAEGAYAIADALLAERSKPAATAAEMQHVAYFVEGEFHWMSGIKPRACELFAERAKGGA